MREESHLEDMRAAIRGDFERLKERRGDQELMVSEGDAEAASDPSPAEEGELGDASPPTLQQSVASDPAAAEQAAAAEPEPSESPPGPVPAARAADSAGAADTPEVVTEDPTPALQQTVTSEPVPDEQDAAAEPEPSESPPEPDVPTAGPPDSAGTADTPEAATEDPTPALQQTVTSEPEEAQPRRSWLDRVLGR